MIGLVFLFLDDLLWAGTSTLYQVICQFRTIFHIVPENQDAFTYFRVNLKKIDDSVIIDQFTYGENLKTLLNKQSS